MKLRFPTAAIAAVTFLAGLAAGLASPVLAEETDRTPITANNLRPQVQVPPPVGEPAQTPAIVFAPAAEIVQQPAAVPAVATSGDVAFTSLDAAVAAQPAAIDSEELDCLATTIYYEAKGEPLAGQLAVAEVILNRAQSGRFPRSICSVVTQPGQFSFVRGGKLPEVDESRRAWKVAVAIAHVAAKELWDSPVEGALYFHARHLSPKWNRARVAAVGNHVFYR